MDDRYLRGTMLTRAWRTNVVLGALVLAAVVAPIAGAQAAVAPIGPDPMEELVEPGTTVQLSDETKVTRWAHPADAAPIRRTPSATAPTIAKLRFETEDHMPEVYLVLDAEVDDDGIQWLHIRIPGKPNGRMGWVPADVLNPLNAVRTQLTVVRRTKKAILRNNGRIVWQAPIGIGKSSTPTPTGNFWVRELLKGKKGSIYGPWAFGTSAYSSIADWHGAPVVGIHGTNQPGLIPGAPSHGCVRLRNDKISGLVRLMPIGTPVKIT
jgi:hypothetical protein